MKIKQTGFTIVELLIVIVVIAILAAMSIVAYNGIQERARESHIASDLRTLEEAIVIARDLKSETLAQITGATYTAGQCANNGIESEECANRYELTMERIEAASGVEISEMRDPWGRPYFIDENERSPDVQCSTDSIAAFAYPFSSASRYPDSERRIAMSGYTGC